MYSKITGGNILFSVKILNFSINLGLGAKKLRPFVEKFQSGLSQLPPTCPQEHLEEEYFFEIFLVFPIVFGNWAKIFRLILEKISSCLSQLHPTCLLESLEEDFFCETFSFSFRFRTLSETFSTFSRIFFVGLSQLHSTCPQERLVED